MRPIFRYLVRVLVPGCLVVAAAWASADRLTNERELEGLDRITEAVGVLLRADLEQARLALAARAEPDPAPAIASDGVQRALAGDTVLQLFSVPGESAIGLRVLLPAAGDTTAPIATAEGRLRSRAALELRDRVGIAAALYIDGVREAGDTSATPASLAPAEGPERRTVDGAAARLLPIEVDGSTGAGISLLLVRPADPPPPIGALGRALTAVLLLFGSGVVLLGLAGRPNAPKLSGAGLVLVLVTVVGTAGYASERVEERMRRTTIQELTRIGVLGRAYDRLDDPAAIAELTGHRALLLTGSSGRTSDGGPVPMGAESLPTPPPAFPATGRLASSGEIYVALRSETGRAVLLRPADGVLLSIVITLVGALAVGFGTWSFLRSRPFAEVRGRWESPGEVAVGAKE